MRIFLLLISTLSFVSFSQNQWVIKDSINGAPRSASSAFTINGEGYTVAGLDESGFRRKMYSYTYWQDDWDEEASIGGLNGSGLNRGSACGFGIDNKGYVCLGQGETNPFFKDLWEYDPSTNSWAQKADFIGSARRQSVAFVINSMAYVGTGIDATGMKKDMYRYDPTTNTWTQIADFGGTARKEAVGITMGGQGYIGTGDDGVYRKDFWQYEPLTDTWSQKPDFPGTPRKGAVGWSSFPSLFICTGEDNNFTYTKDLYEYNYFAELWVQRADFIGEGRTNAIAFEVNGLGFVGSGYNGDFFDDFYAYRPILGIEEFKANNKISVFPNPTIDYITIETSIDKLNIFIYSINGQDVTDELTINKIENGYRISKENITSGQYFIRLIHPEYGELQTEKIIFLDEK